MCEQISSVDVCLKMKCNTLFVFALIFIFVIKDASCLNKRCIRCRSRGELGSCGDPFPFNVTEPEADYGIHVVACPSGWCGKLIQGSTGTFRNDDYGAVTERMCLQRPPSDYEERCAYTMWNRKKVYMCFCNGDLCNSSVTISSFPFTILSLLFVYKYVA